MSHPSAAQSKIASWAWDISGLTYAEGLPVLKDSWLIMLSVFIMLLSLATFLKNFCAWVRIWVRLRVFTSCEIFFQFLPYLPKPSMKADCSSSVQRPGFRDSHFSPVCKCQLAPVLVLDPGNPISVCGFSSLIHEEVSPFSKSSNAFLTVKSPARRTRSFAGPGNVEH